LAFAKRAPKPSPRLWTAVPGVGIRDLTVAEFEAPGG
jgi:hypothetical protein